MVPVEHMFGIILNCHVEVAVHKSIRTTHTILKKSYANITEKQVTLFVNKCCPVCKLKQKAKKATRDVTRHARFQADLINYCMDPCVDRNGVSVYGKTDKARMVSLKQKKYVPDHIMLFESDDDGEESDDKPITNSVNINENPKKEKEEKRKLDDMTSDASQVSTSTPGPSKQMTFKSRREAPLSLELLETKIESKSLSLDGKFKAKSLRGRMRTVTLQQYATKI